MAEDTTTTPLPSVSQEDSGRGSRPGGPRDREAGGFRIRLSDNEMQAARALQEAFGLRSTVAVLGFALRTLAQQLEQGQLQELVAQHRAQGGGRPPAPRGGDRRRERPEGGEGRGGEGRGGEGRGGGRGGGPRLDPFARPSRPAAPVASVEAAGEAEPAGPGDAAAEPVPFAEGTGSDEVPSSPSEAPSAEEAEAVAVVTEEA